MRGPEVVRAWFGAFAARDRAGAERLMAEGFRFTSPYDDAIDSAEFFERCWRMPEGMSAPVIERIAGEGADWFVRYHVPYREGDLDDVEHVVVHDGRIESTRVFFGNRAFGDEG